MQERVDVGVWVWVWVWVWGVHNVYCWAIQADETVKLTYVGYTRAVCVTHGLYTGLYTGLHGCVCVLHGLCVLHMY